MDLQDSVQRSLQNPAENIMQIFTDSQRLKTWVVFIQKDILERHWFQFQDSADFIMWRIKGNFEVRDATLYLHLHL